MKTLKRLLITFVIISITYFTIAGIKYELKQQNIENSFVKKDLIFNEEQKGVEFGQ